MPNTFADIIRDARKQAGLSQLQLASMAGVSPKTIAKVEDGGVVRVDAIVRLSKALGLPVDQSLAQTKQHIAPAKLEDILLQERSRRTESPFPQLTPDAYLQRTFERLNLYKVGLRCICVMAPLYLATPAILASIREIIEANLHIAIVSPFPLSSTSFIQRYAALSSYYTRVYNWAQKATDDVRQHIPAAQGRIHFFVPKVQDNQSLFPVYPPIRVAEIRPVLTQYGHQDTGNSGGGSQRLIEFGVYFHFLDHRADHWVDVCPDENANLRGIETRDMWQSYFRDILEAWKPANDQNSNATYDFKGPSFWELVES